MKARTSKHSRCSNFSENARHTKGGSSRPPHAIILPFPIFWIHCEDRVQKVVNFFGKKNRTFNMFDKLYRFEAWGNNTSSKLELRELKFGKLIYIVDESSRKKSLGKFIYLEYSQKPTEHSTIEEFPRKLQRKVTEKIGNKDGRN